MVSHTHPARGLLSQVPRPDVRDMLIERPGEYSYQLWTENFTPNVSVNWKFDICDAVSGTGDDLVFHSTFEKHVRNLKNWSVSPEFQKLFPDLVRAIHFSD
jgi:hypothetical protein